jgi:hypothetical protein
MNVPHEHFILSIFRPHFFTFKKRLQIFEDKHHRVSKG